MIRICFGFTPLGFYRCVWLCKIGTWASNITSDPGPWPVNLSDQFLYNITTPSQNSTESAKFFWLLNAQQFHFTIFLAGKTRDAGIKLKPFDEKSMRPQSVALEDKNEHCGVLFTCHETWSCVNKLGLPVQVLLAKLLTFTRCQLCIYGYEIRQHLIRRPPGI